MSEEPEHIDNSHDDSDGDDRAELNVDTLEARILLSATWVEADAGEQIDEPTSGDDIFLGDATDNTADALGGDDQLFGFDGNDDLFGNDGNDTLAGGQGDDLLDGGKGVDTADYSDAKGDVNVRLAGKSVAPIPIVQPLSSITEVSISAEKDGVSGISVSPVVVSPLPGIATGGAGTDTLIDIENVTGSDYNDTLIGDTGANTLDGGAGNDRIYGGAQDDVLISGGGNDYMSGGNQNDTFRFTDARDGDVITVDGGNDTDTIDLSEFRKEQIADDGSTIKVDLGGNESFTIQYSNIENIVTGPENSEPDAVEDVVSTDEDTPVTTDNVLKNDTDLDGDTLSVDSFTQPEHGTVVYNEDGTFTYTPEADYNGPDSFTYTVTDDNGGTDTATVDVTVDAVNDAPTDLLVTSTQDNEPLQVEGADAGVTVVGIYAPGSDTNILEGTPSLETLSDHNYFDHGSLGHTGYNYMGGHHWFSDNGVSISGLRGGSVVFSDGTTGEIDTVSNGAGDTESAYIYYRAYDQDVDATIDENSPAGTTVATLSATDPDEGDSVTYSIADNENFEVVGNELRVKPGAQLNHEVNARQDIEVTVTDSAGESYVETITVHIADVNEAPSDISLIPDLDNPGNLTDGATAGNTVVGIYAPNSGVNLLEDAPELETLSNHNYFEHDSLGHTGYNYMGGHHWFSDNDISTSGLGGGTVVFSDGTTGEIDAVSNGAGDSESAYIYYRAYDPSADATVSEAAEPGTQVASLNANDPDAGDDVTYSIVGDSGQFEIVDNNIQVKDGATLDYETATSHDITIRATDAGGLSYDKIFTIRVDDVNDDPIVDAGADQTVTEGASITMSTSASDPEGDNLTYSWEQLSGTPVELANGDTAEPTFTATYLMEGEHLEFQVTVSDGENSVTDTVTISVDADNDIPVINAGVDQLVAGGATVTLDANASSAPENVDFGEIPVESYGGDSQDINVSVAVEDGGDTIRLTGNGWKKIDFPYTVTEDTILEFDFRSGSEGEIHGIGFDSDGQLNSDRTFKVHGTQSWGIADYDNYEAAEGEWQHYRIRVGDHFTGDFDRLTFAMDHDVSGPDGESVFSNIRVFEEGQGDPAGEQISYTWEQISGPEVTLSNENTANPTFEAPESQLYGQDIEFQVTVSDGVHNVTDTVRISVEGNPDGILVDAGEDLAANEEETVSLGVSTETAVSSISLDDTPVESYGGSGQDINVEVAIEDGGDTIRLTGNGWKRIDFPYTVTEDTILEFDFKSGSEGEIHGIGFDNDAQLNADQTFKVHGTQGWGIRDHDNYDAAEGEWQHYRIRVGDHFTGDFDYLTFAMDHDVSGPDGESLFSNIRVFEDGQTDTSGEGLTYTWHQVSGPPVALENADTANPTFTTPDLKLSEDVVFEVTVSNGKTTVTDTVTVSINADDEEAVHLMENDEAEDPGEIDWSDTELTAMNPDLDMERVDGLFGSTEELLAQSLAVDDGGANALDAVGEVVGDTSHDGLDFPTVASDAVPTYQLKPLTHTTADGEEIRDELRLANGDNAKPVADPQGHGDESGVDAVARTSGASALLWGLFRGVAGTRDTEEKDAADLNSPRSR